MRLRALRVEANFLQLFGIRPVAGRVFTSDADRPVLVTLEIAFSMVLLTGAGLLLRSLWKLESVPLGMDTGRVLMARFVLGRQHYGRDEQQLAFFNDLERRLAAAPGVDAAAISDSIPPSGRLDRVRTLHQE